MPSKLQSMRNRHLGQVSVRKHQLELMAENVQPIHCTLYRAGSIAKEFDNAEIEKTLLQRVIKPAQEEWATPTVFAEKKDGSLRFYVDCQHLNAIIEGDSYSMLGMDQCNDSLGEAAVFFTLGANQKFWRVEAKETECDRTALTSHYGLYRLIQMPFRLTDVPGIYQRPMDVILSPVKWRSALVYIDDTIVFSRLPRKHDNHVKGALSLLQVAGGALKPNNVGLLQK